MGAGLPGPQPARRSPLGLRGVRVCRGHPAGPLCAAGASPGVGVGGRCGLPAFPGRAQKLGAPAALPQPAGGALEVRGLGGGSRVCPPPEQLGLQAPLRGILHQKDWGGRGGGVQAGPRLPRSVPFLRADLVPDLLRQNHDLSRKAKYLYAKIWSSGASVLGKKAEKMQAFCVAFFIDSLFTSFFASPEYFHFR